ncbi:MAG: helix-turn-helix domain-containing protein [Thermoproteota archaeon]
MPVIIRLDIRNNCCDIFDTLKEHGTVVVNVRPHCGGRVYHYARVLGVRDANKLLEALRRLKREYKISFAKTASSQVDVMVEREPCKFCTVLGKVQGCVTLNYTRPLDGPGKVVVACMKSKDAQSFLEALRAGGDGACYNVVGVRRSRYLSTAELTPKQIEALLLAVSLGYYDVPRRAKLEDIARVMGISTSAAADILRRAEAKAVKKVLLGEG